MTVTGSSFRKAVGGGQDPLTLERRAGRWLRRGRDHRGQGGPDHAHSNRSGRTLPLGPWTKWWKARALSGGSALTSHASAARGARLQHEAGRRVDEAGRADRQEHQALAASALHEHRDLVEEHRVEGLAEPDDRRAQQAGAAAGVALVAGRRSAEVLAVVGEGLALAQRAAGLEEAPVHLDEAEAPRAAVEAVHVLRDEQEAVAQAGLRRGERLVAGVRLDGLRLPPPLGVEAPDELGVLGEPLGGRHLLDRVALPEAVRVAEGGDAALGGDAGPGQDQQLRVVVDPQSHRGMLALSGAGGTS